MSNRKRDRKKKGFWKYFSSKRMKIRISVRKVLSQTRIIISRFSSFKSLKLGTYCIRYTSSVRKLIEIVGHLENELFSSTSVIATFSTRDDPLGY